MSDINIKHLDSQDLQEDECFDDIDYEDLYDSEASDLELKDLEDEDKLTYGTVALPHWAEDKQENNESGNCNESKELQVYAGDEDAANDDDIGSDEEKEILKGIRDEIEMKVRDEMKDELNGFKHKLKALEHGKVPGDADEKDDMDPKLKDAIAKMKKLDKILNKKIRKEKEVKRERILLEKRMREEISEMQHGSSHYKEIKVNTERFLALAPPPSHNEGIKLVSEETIIPPLFQTQIDDAEILWKSGKQRQLDEDDISHLDNSGLAPDDTSCNDGTRSGTSSSRPGQKGRKSKKDFIRRNKELAADAGEIIAMTDDEKKRIQDLLGDIDTLPELPDQELELSGGLQGNAFQVCLHPGQGFQPDNIEMKSLTHINERLKTLMPDESFRSIMQTPQSASQPPLFSRVALHSGSDIPERFGERVLYDTKEERDLKARLESIEEQLNTFKLQNDEEAEGNSHLTDEQLDNLLDQCARDFSSMSYIDMDVDTPDLSARSHIESRQSMMDNPPKLSEEQLQQLLSEAHFPLSSVLLSLRDDDQKIEEEEGNAETIKAETWKAISEESLEGKEHILRNVPPVDKGEENVSQNALDASADLTSRRSSNMKNTAGNDMVLESFDSDKFLLDESETISSSDQLVSESFSGAGFAQCSVREAPVLPKINSRSSFSAENPAMHSVTPTSNIPLPNDDTGEQVRLPDIHSTSFLVQASQGMNNASRKSSESLPSRKPLRMVHNDLTDSRSSMGSLEEDRSQSLSRKSSNGANSHLVPRPPSKDGPPGKTNSKA